jgi:hypothetical protein
MRDNLVIGPISCDAFIKAHIQNNKLIILFGLLPSLIQTEDLDNLISLVLGWFFEEEI